MSSVFRVTILSCIFSAALISFSASAQQTLNGTLFLESGFATSDMNIRVEVTSLDVNNEFVEFFIDDVVIAANTGSVTYEVQGITGDRLTLRYLCLENDCGRFVREAYLTANGPSFVFSNDAVLANNQFAMIQNFTLVIGNTVSGTIFLPRSVPDRELMIIPVAQFVFGQEPSTVFRQFFPEEPISVPVNTTQIEFTIEGLPPIPNEPFFPFSFCQNCQPQISSVGLTAGVVLTEGGNVSSEEQAANSIPSNQNNTGVQLFHSNGTGGSGAAIIPPILQLLLE